MNQIDGGPAFPRAGSEDRRQGDMPDGNSYDRPEDGMSLRDWFAGQALAVVAQYQAMRHNAHFLDEQPEGAAGYAAIWAYEIADAMLKERTE